MALAHTATSAPRIKVCGLTRARDVSLCVELGVDTLGLNFWPGTRRHVDVARAKALVDAAGGRAELVAVFVDADEATIRHTLDATGIVWAQLHGSEPPALLEAFLPSAYKALGVRPGEDGEAVLSRAARYGGEHVLLDASVPGAMPGGTGKTFDWRAAEALARVRKLTLAGGLTPTNVAEAIRRIRPHRVDVASGVESEPGVKDEAKLRAFVEAVRGAS